MRTTQELKDFYAGKKVLVTGHTGFKGSYLTVLLSLLGAEVYGYALDMPSPSLFEILYGTGAGDETRENLQVKFSEDHDREGTGPAWDLGIRESHIGDIRNFDEYRAFYDKVQPDIVLHLAAQPIVRVSYDEPRLTYETNVLGTVNVLEAVRLNPCARSVLNVTTDKVYLNEERENYAYKEDDKLDGFDPYSNSKSCSDLVTHSYAASFLRGMGIGVSTARAGNVFGGGDFAKNRIVPDCVRAFVKGVPLEVRNPYSVRPYQFVLEPLMVYLLIAMEQYLDPAYAGWYNVGPDDEDCVTTGELATKFASNFDGFTWVNTSDPNAPHEAGFLKLNNQRLKDVFGWKPLWHIDEAVLATTAWTNAWIKGSGFANEELRRQIEKYLEE